MILIGLIKKNTYICNLKKILFDDFTYFNFINKQ